MPPFSALRDSHLFTKKAVIRLPPRRLPFYKVLAVLRVMLNLEAAALRVRGKSTIELRIFMFAA